MTATQPPADCFRAELSPEAQAVKDAAWASFWSNEAMAPNDAEIIAAAVLAAAADQVVPEHTNPVGDEHDEARTDQWTRIRCQLLAIAAELRERPRPSTSNTNWTVALAWHGQQRKRSRPWNLS